MKHANVIFIHPINKNKRINDIKFNLLKIKYIMIVEEAKILINDLYKETLDLLSNNKSSLDKLALLLLENETLHEEEINNFRNNI